MKRQTIIVSALFLAFSCAGVAFADGSNALTLEGRQAYAQHDYEKARQIFQKLIAEDPLDSEAHYMLGNVLVELGLREAAVREYQISLRVGPNNASSHYSMEALKLLEREARPPQASPEVQPQIKERAAASVIGAQTSASDQALLAERDAKVQRISDEAEARIKKLNDEMQERIAENGPPIYRPTFRGGRVCTYDPSSLNDEVKKEYGGRIDDIKNIAHKQADEVIKAYKEKQAAIDSTASLLDPTRSAPDSTVRLVPNGTTVYTRNYETKDEPTGLPTPVKVTTPRGSLSPTSTQKKDSTNDKAHAAKSN